MRRHLKLCALALALSFTAPLHAATDATAVLSTYADLAYASYGDSLTTARKLQQAIADFTRAPSEQGLQQARQAWLDAREPYGQTEVFRFYGGPIDDERDLEGRINPWPLDEAYIDSVKGKPKSGFINNPKVELKAERLIKLNAKGGEANISMGYHAIEFLLWGQDFDPKGPGQRSYTDFVDGKAPNADRRRQYLQILADQLVADLEIITGEWKPEAKNYRARFLADAPDASLRKVLTGMAVLSSAELAGERMQVALDNQDMEDEHSCFSDNTHRDIYTDALGIRNVLLGEYTRVDGSVLKGPGVRDLIAERNPALAQRLQQDFDATVASAAQIQAPFDQEIIGGKNAPGRLRVKATINALKKQTKTLVEGARALNIRKLSIEPGQ